MDTKACNVIPWSRLVLAARPLRTLAAIALAVLALGAVQPASAQGSLDPDRLDFGEVLIGDDATLIFEYTADSSLIVAVNFDSNNSTFAVSPRSIKNPIVNEPEIATVRFRPRTVGLHSGAIIVTVDVLVGDSTVRLPVGEVEVVGVGFAPFDVDPMSLLFEPTLLGQTSEPIRVRVSLPMDEEIGGTFRVISGNPDVFIPTPTSFDLMPGESAFFDVTFSPALAGENSSAIIVSALGVDYPIDAMGEGIAVTIDPPALDLPPTLTGCSSDALMTVIPALTADIILGPLDRRFTANPTQFIASAPTNVVVSIASAPAGITTTDVVVNTREGGRPVQQIFVPTTATGFEVLANPGSLDFGSISVGSTSSPQTILLETSLPAMLGAMASSDNPAFEIVSAEEGLVQVVFSPQVEGPASGTITVQASTPADPDCMRPLRIPVSGIGQALGLSLAPTSLDFGETPVNSSSTLLASIVNESSTAFEATALSSDPAFRVDGMAFAVPAGASVPVEVIFGPNLEGPASGQITFQLTALGVTPLDLVLPVSGVGFTPTLSYSTVIEGATTPVLPGGSIQAPAIAVGGTSTFDLVVSNPSTAVATITSIGVSGDAFGPQIFPTVVREIEPGGALTLSLTFEPTAPGLALGSLQVGGASFSLSGVGLLGGASITGWPGGLRGLEQFAVGVALDQAAVGEVSGELTLSYEPDGDLPADPSVVLANGGDTIAFTVPAGQTQAVFEGGGQEVGLQTGSVASVITLAATFSSGETAITPPGGVFVSSPVAGQAPVITSVEITAATASGFTVVVQGYSTTREVTGMRVSFQPRGDVDLAAATVTVAGIGEAFTTYFGGQTEFGGQFRVSVPFTVAGATNAIASASVVISNGQGDSAAVSANLP